MPSTTNNRRLAAVTRPGSRCAALAATAGLAFSAVSAVIGTLPPVASAGPAQAFDIWNLSAGPLEVTSAYPPDGPGMPQEGAKIPIGKNLQIPVGTRSYVLIRLLGRKPINQGQRPQAWKINMSTDNPTPTPDIRCTVEGDPKQPPVAACGNYIGNNVAIVADGQPGSKTTVPASDAQAQAIVVNNLCGNPWPQALRISCSYSGIQ